MAEGVVVSNILPFTYPYVYRRNLENDFWDEKKLVKHVCEPAGKWNNLFCYYLKDKRKIISFSGVTKKYKLWLR